MPLHCDALFPPILKRNPLHCATIMHIAHAHALALAHALAHAHAIAIALAQCTMHSHIAHAPT